MFAVELSHHDYDAPPQHFQMTQQIPRRDNNRLDVQPQSTLTAGVTGRKLCC